MDAKNALSEKLEFSTLAEIMERFNTVPYIQFQQELNDWFNRNLAKSRQANALQDPEHSGAGNLPALVSEIFHRAELQHALSAAKIRQGHERK